MTHIRLMERAMEKSGTNVASLVPKFDCPPIQNFIPTEFVSGGKSKFVSIVWKAYSNELKTVQNFCMPTEPGQQNHSAKLMYPPCSMTKLKFGEHEVNVYMMERGQGAFFQPRGYLLGSIHLTGKHSKFHLMRIPGVRRRNESAAKIPLSWLFQPVQKVENHLHLNRGLQLLLHCRPLRPSISVVMKAL